MSSPFFENQLDIFLLLHKIKMLEETTSLQQDEIHQIKDEIHQIKSRLGCVENQMDSISDIVSCSPMFDSGDVMSVADWINSRED